MIRVSATKAILTLQDAREKLGNKQFSKAITRGINETILQSRTVARGQVKSRYNVPQRYMNRVDVKKASAYNMTARLWANATPLPMDAFSPTYQTATATIRISRRGEQKIRDRKAKRTAALGVSITVVKGSKQTIPFAFMIPGSKARVFARGSYNKGSSYGFNRRHKRVNNSGNDTPIKPLLSIAIHTAVVNKQSLKKIKQVVGDVYPRSIQRNVSHFLATLNR